MVKIAGKYLLQKNEKFLEHLVALGIPEEKAKVADDLRPHLEIVIDGKKITLNSDSGVENSSSALVQDEEVDEPLPLGITVKSTAKISGDTLTVSSRTESGKSGERVYKVTDTELVLTLTSADPKVPTAKRFYKRV